jgi:hypothetical protein
MKLRTLILVVAVLGLVDAAVGWRSARTAARRDGGPAGEIALVDATTLERARRIVIREKPQAKVVAQAEGFEVRAIPDRNAPIRETVLVRGSQETWSVANCFGLDADAEWLGQTMRDLSQGRVIRRLTSDPQLMDDMELDLGLVRFEDEKGATLRELEFGRKDGGNSYQIVRTDHRDALLVKHDTEIVGDPTVWIVNRRLRFEPAAVREMDVSILAAGEQPLVLRRNDAKANWSVDGESGDAAARIGAAMGELLETLVREPVMEAFAKDSPLAEAARKQIVCRARFKLFDGREYRVSYGLVPDGTAGLETLNADFKADLAFGFVECSDTNDLVSRYNAKATFAFSRGATVNRFPKSRAAVGVVEK